MSNSPSLSNATRTRKHRAYFVIHYASRLTTRGGPGAQTRYPSAAGPATIDTLTEVRRLHKASRSSYHEVSRHVLSKYKRTAPPTVTRNQQVADRHRSLIEVLAYTNSHLDRRRPAQTVPSLPSVQFL